MNNNYLKLLQQKVMKILSKSPEGDTNIYNQPHVEEENQKEQKYT